MHFPGQLSQEILEDMKVKQEHGRQAMGSYKQKRSKILRDV
eukprot:gene4641-14976_t